MKGYEPVNTFIYTIQDIIGMNQIIKSVEQVTMGQQIGFAWTANNDAFKTVGNVVSIKGNTIKIQSTIDARFYKAGQVFTYSFRKVTKSNHVFEVDSIEQVNEFNNKQQSFVNQCKEIADKIVTEQIETMEKERKQQGVYVESETYSMDWNKGKMVKVSTNYGISQ